MAQFSQRDKPKQYAISRFGINCRGVQERAELWSFAVATAPNFGDASLFVASFYRVVLINNHGFQTTDRFFGSDCENVVA